MWTSMKCRKSAYTYTHFRTDVTSTMIELSTLSIVNNSYWLNVFGSQLIAIRLS